MKHQRKILRSLFRGGAMVSFWLPYWQGDASVAATYCGKLNALFS